MVFTEEEYRYEVRLQSGLLVPRCLSDERPHMTVGFKPVNRHQEIHYMLCQGCLFIESYDVKYQKIWRPQELPTNSLEELLGSHLIHPLTLTSQPFMNSAFLEGCISDKPLSRLLKKSYFFSEISPFVLDTLAYTSEPLLKLLKRPSLKMYEEQEKILVAFLQQEDRFSRLIPEIQRLLDKRKKGRDVA